MISTSERGQLQSESTNPEVDENDGKGQLQSESTNQVDENDGKEFSLLCSDCGCEGTENVDYKSLGSAVSPPECMRLVKADTTSFCGSEFEVGRDNGEDKCWCRASDKPCPQTPRSGWSVYSMQAKIDQGVAREPAVDGARRAGE
jgi:hypothetical protein